jgi:hypothetical protein
VYVGVYAWSRASFSIMASLNTGWVSGMEGEKSVVGVGVS